MNIIIVHNLHYYRYHECKSKVIITNYKMFFGIINSIFLCPFFFYVNLFGKFNVLLIHFVLELLILQRAPQGYPQPGGPSAGYYSTVGAAPNAPGGPPRPFQSQAMSTAQVRQRYPPVPASATNPNPSTPHFFYS